MKKIVLTLIILAVSGFLIYFFLPKKVKICGSVLPISCAICECKRGIPLRGFPTLTCLFGEKPECGEFKYDN